MAKIIVDGEFTAYCSENCLHCIVEKVCNRESIDMTHAEFEMLQTCRYRATAVWASCDECPSRFICYTSKINKFADRVYWKISGVDSG